MSSKNTLQEFTQKQGFTLPLYDSKSIEDPNTKKILGWKSTVYLNLAKEKNQSVIKNFNGRMLSTKIGAELDAANEALRSLGLINTTSITAPLQPIPMSTLNTSDFRLEPGKFYTNFILIDLENTPSFNLTPKKDILYVGFINEHHHSIREYEKRWNIFRNFNSLQGHLDESYSRTDLYPNCLIITIAGGVTDLSDHLITAWLCFLIDYLRLIPVESISKLTVNLCSRDHGVWCTKECLLKFLKFHKMDQVVDLNVVSTV